MRRLILFLWAASGILAQGQNISPGVPSVYRGYRLDAAQVDTVLSETVLTKVELLQKRQMPTATAKSTVSAHRSSAAQTRSAIPKSFSPNQSKLVGEIPINEGVSPMGARTYTVPVQVAPGIKGVQPSLSLSYNSMGGDGCLGKGWNISGLSAIVRGNQSIYYDGKTQGAENAKHDAFYLDGMRLIRIGSSTSKNTYQSEQGHIKAEGYLSGSCVKYFKVYYPNGSIAVMGYSNNSSHKSVFPITQIQDKNSNVMDYAYDNVYNNYRIKAINYGKNGSKPHFATVEFHYITRSDYSFAWHGGLKTENRDLLSRITCTGSSTHLTSYAFSYTGQHHQLLEQINCAVNGSSLNPLRFYYGGEQQRAKFEKSSTQLVSYFNSSATGSLDLKKGKFDAWSDDDGLIVRPHKAAYKEYYQSGSLFSHSKRWYRNMMHSEQELLVYFDLASSWAHPQKVKAGKGFIDMFAADIDGKAGDEVIKTRLYPNGSKDYIIFEVYRPAPVSSGVAIAPDYTRTFSAPTALDWYGTKSPHPRFFYPGDYNGDGRMEILVVTCYGPFERTSVKSTCYLYDLHNNKKLYEGQVFDFKAGFAGASISDALFPLDYNGDGKMDICHINSSGTHIYSFTSSGSSVSALRKISTYSGLNSAHLRHKHFKVGEFNGDGKADFLLSPKASYSRYETHSIPLHLPRRCYCCSSEHPIEPPVTAAGDSNGRFRCKYCDCPLPTSSKCYECSRPLTHDLYTKRYRCSHHGTMTTIRVSKYISLGKSWTIYHSKGNGYFDKKTMDVCNRDEDDKYELVDMNGDGTTDLVSRKASGALTIYPARQGLISGTALSGYESIGYGGYLVPSDISQGKYHSKLLALKDDKIHKVAYTIDESAQGLLTTAVSSFGIASKTHYARMNSGEYTPSPLYIKGYSAVFPYQDFSGPLYLTSETQSWNGNSKIAHQSFTYREALLHRQGLGLRGFKRIDTYDGISGAYTYAYYDPTRFGVMTKTVTQESTTTYRYSTWTSYNKIANIRLNSRRIEDKLKGNTITQTYSYDGYGNPIRETIYYDGNTRTFTELSYFNNTSLRNYILGIPKEKKVSKTSGSDTFVEKTKWVYSNSKGQPYSITRYHNDEQAGQVHYAYDRFGNVTSETRKPYSSAHALRTRYTYSSDGRFLTESTNPMGQKTSFTRNARGEISQKKNFKGHSTMYEYDALGRVKSVQHPSGERQFTLYRWDTSEEKSLYTIRSTSNTAPTQISYYDAMGRIVQTASLELSGWVYTYTEYDSQGRLYRSSLPTRDKTKRWVTTTYDRYNRPVRINEASGAVTSYQYKGNSVTASKNGRTSTQTTNARGDLIRATDPGGTITYSIRGDGQAAFVVAPGGVKTSFVYDKHGRKIKMTDPSAGTITYAYDAAGNLKSQTNANNKTTTFSYDPYNRLTKEVRPELSSTYTYNTNGLLSTVHSNNGTKISYSYNNLLQLQTVSESIDGRSYSEDYTYDSSGNWGNY